MNEKEITDVEKALKICTKQWATVDDVMALCSIGRNKALEFVKDLKKEMKDKGIVSFSNTVPMGMLINKLNLDIDFMLSLYKIKKYITEEEK